MKASLKQNFFTFVQRSQIFLSKCFLNLLIIFFFLKFILKVATRIMKEIIEKFAVVDLFGRANYEFYARITGRVIKVQDEWICSFIDPPPPRRKLFNKIYLKNTK